jgi:hypothetical protein
MTSSVLAESTSLQRIVPLACHCRRPRALCANVGSILHPNRLIWDRLPTSFLVIYIPTGQSLFPASPSRQRATQLQSFTDTKSHIGCSINTSTLH